MFRLKRILFIIVPAGILLLVFVYDVVRRTVEFDGGGMMYFREAGIAVAFFSIFLFLDSQRAKRGSVAPKEMGKLLITALGAVAVIGVVQMVPSGSFTELDASYVPGNSVTVFFSLILAVAVGVVAIISLLTIKDLVFHKRKKGTRRNFLIYVVTLLGASFLLFPFLAEEISVFSTGPFIGATVMIVVNSFRQNWIVYLSRREKIYCIIYSALLSLTFLALSLLLTNRTFLNKAMVFFSNPLERFVLLNMIFGATYFGMAFVTTLFHLPTAEVYERKQSELNSLHNLSRLVTRVFDFRDLVNTVTHLTREVCGARSAWLELVKREGSATVPVMDVVAMDNISREEIEKVMVTGESSLRQLVFESKKVLLIDEVSSDRRTRHIKELGIPIGSMLGVPLMSHGELIGILHATKDINFGFDQDDIDVLTTFADHVTIAIENSKLIARSLERERFQQEMLVAQQMQKRLLPQWLPNHDALDIAAVSEPSMEVGGDYFDFVDLDRNRLGVVVGDVSGKGVSAAFYMAEVKGIFQSLSKLCPSPKDLLVQANSTLMGSLEKRAFISLLYAVFDIPKATLQLARAGHCPMIRISKSTTELVRPNGLGLGLTNGELFSRSTEEMVLDLNKGDVYIFYTDGITESRNESGEEFGYERLVDLAKTVKDCAANEIKDRILSEIRLYSGSKGIADDLTLIVVKWRGSKEPKDSKLEAQGETS